MKNIELIVLNRYNSLLGGIMSIKICDTTLRDAKFSPSIFFSRDETVEIAELLDKIGVDEVELGIPTYSQEEFDTIKYINDKNLSFKSSCIFFCTSEKKIEYSINKAINCGCSAICISIPVSKQLMNLKLKKNESGTLELMKKAVGYAVKKGLYTTFSGEDASRSEMRFLIKYIKAGEECGANRFRFAETVSYLEPQNIKENVSEIKKYTNIDLEIHSHSAYGLGLANAIAAFDSGASWASGTVNGIGERGGNTNIIEMILYLYKFKKQNKYDIKKLKELSDVVQLYSNDKISRFAPIVGSAAFEYENFKQYLACDLYEDYKANSVGNSRNLILGKKLNLETIKYWNIAQNDVKDNKAILLDYMYKNKKSLDRKKLKCILERCNYEK